MKSLRVQVQRKNVDYPLVIERGLVKRLDEAILPYVTPDCRICLITDENVAALYLNPALEQLKKAGFRIYPFVVPAGESSKSLTQLSAIWEQLVAWGFKRTDAIIAFGGGVVGDLAGFAAASFLRGLDLIQIPTTLLSQVDSSVGGKVAIDLSEGKNLVGAFYHPKAVFMDPDVLETLSDEQFSSGMAEVIKYALIGNEDFFNQLLEKKNRDELMESIENILATCCAMKRDLVATDEKDRGQRMLLNFGHTIGHAIEAYYAYHKYNHGQAIAIGMVYMTSWAEEKGYSPKGLTQNIRQLLTQHELPVRLDQAEDLPQILPFMRRDKKNLGSQLNVVVIESVGKAKILQVNESFERELLDSLKEI